MTIAPQPNFDLATVRRHESRCRAAGTVTIDLSACEWVNTEALAFMLRLHRDGVAVRILHPPELFLKVLQTLQLQAAFAPLLSPVENPQTGAES